MNKKEVFSHFSAIIDKMIDNSDFFPYFFQHPFSLDNNITNNERLLDEGVHLNFGANRGCFVDNNYDYVVKFDVDGFEQKHDSACAFETEIFARAKEENLDMCFAEATYIGTYCRTISFYDIKIDPFNGELDFIYDDEVEKHMTLFINEGAEEMDITISIPLYAYPRAVLFDGPFHSNEQEKKIARSIMSPLRDRNLMVALLFIQTYGEEIYKELSSFLLEEDINDLHLGNIGLINGKIVLIDYAGYV